MRSYKKAFRDQDGDLITVYDPRQEGSLNVAWDSICSAYKGGRITKSMYVGMQEFFGKRGVDTMREEDSRLADMLGRMCDKRPGAVDRILDDVNNFDSEMNEAA